MKTKHTLTIIAALVAIIGIQFALYNESEYVVSKNICPSLEEQVREMDEEQVNKLMIVISETLIKSEKEAKRPEYEKKMEQELAYDAEVSALTHMNDVLGVLIKSVGAMPTTTLSVR